MIWIVCRSKTGDREWFEGKTFDDETAGKPTRETANMEASEEVSRAASAPIVSR